MGQAVVHFQVMGQDAKALREFYTSAFDWTTSPVGGPVDYHLIEGAGIGGGIGQCPQGEDAQVTFYVSVPDIRAALEKIVRLGGKTIGEPMPLPNGGMMAHFEDPQHNFIGLVQEA